jgi:uncharacterized membrane protein
MNEASMHLLIAAFDEESSAEQELNSLKASGEEKLAGIQAAVAMRKDEHGQLHFKDVGLTPGKGALGGVALGAVIGILTGGTGLALSALGALVGGVVGRRKRDSRFSADRLNQVAASLEPGSSAIVIVAEPGPHGALIEELELLGGDVLTVDIGADVATQLEAHQEAAYAALIGQLQRARDEEDDV